MGVYDSAHSRKNMTEVPLVYVLILIVFMIIITADGMGVGVAIALISATFGVIALLSRNEMMTAAPAAAAAASTPARDPLRDAIMPWQQQDPIGYSRGMMFNQSQTDSYSTCYEPVMPIVAGNGVDLDSTVDGGLALLSQKRANRDKRSMDGNTLKDASFYRFHFDDEMALNENRPWWGRPEY